MAGQDELSGRVIQGASFIFATLANSDLRLLGEHTKASIKTVLVDEAAFTRHVEMFQEWAAHNPVLLIMVGNPKQLPAATPGPLVA
jgi:hypothetical protein